MRKTNPFIHCRCCLLVTSTELMIQPGLRQRKFIIGSAKNGSFHLRLRLLKAIWLKLMNTFLDRHTITQPFNLQVVLQTRIFFFWSTTFLEPEKKFEFSEPLFSNLKKCGVICSINPPFFWSTTFLQPEKNPSLKNHFSQTRLLEPLFYTFLEKWLQIKWSTDNFKSFHMTFQLQFTFSEIVFFA